MKHIQNTKGISLIETMITIAIFSVFILSASTFLLFIFNAEKQTAQYQNLGYQANNVLLKLREYALDAEGIISPSAGNDADNVSIQDSNGDTVNFFLTGDDLFYAEVGSPAARITSDLVGVDAITFYNRSFGDVDVIRVVVDLYMKENEQQVETFYTSFTLRP